MSKPEERFSGMDSVFSGCALDPAKCSRLSLGEKRELVHEISRWSKDAPEILRSFTRPELLEIICAEMGKERKYTGYTKSQMIEHLLKLVSQNSKGHNSFAFSPAHIRFKRKRNIGPPPQLLTDQNHDPLENNEELIKILLCQNVACRATLTPEDAFCKRCSCCICHCYDDNKDPSLWLTCENDMCGLSCHLECALKHERSGILKNGCCKKLDGSFYCVSCGKINALMRTWRKQLLVVKKARRVDVLCLRLSLAHKILMGTALYKEVQRTVESAVKSLTDEVGPLDQVCTSMARCIVNRLSCGAEVQKLCAFAVVSFDSMFCLDYMEKKDPFACRIQFEESTPTSMIIVLEYEDHLLKNNLGCRLWHRESVMKDYPEQPTFIVFRPEKRFKICHLHPSTEYFCKVSLFSSTGVLGVLEAKWETPAPGRSFFTALEHGKAERRIIAQNHPQVESTKSSNIKLAPPSKLQPLVEINKRESEGFDSPPPFPEAVSPSTPRKCSGMRAVPDMVCKKRPKESDYEHSVQVVKWLENEGHIDEDFRVKFLTWFSLKATEQERKVVNVFVDALLDDPPSLAGQLMDTFMDKICCEQKPVSRRGFCFSLWH